MRVNTGWHGVVVTGLHKEDYDESAFKSSLTTSGLGIAAPLEVAISPRPTTQNACPNHACLSICLSVFVCLSASPPLDSPLSSWVHRSQTIARAL